MSIVTLSIAEPTKHGTRVAVILGAMILTSCAGPRRVAIPDAQRSGLCSTTVVVSEQQEIVMRIERSNTGAAVGGLVGGIIDSAVNTSRAKDAELAVTSVRNALVNYDPLSVLAAATEKEIASTKSLKNDGVVVRQFADKEALQSWIQGTNVDNVLVLDVEYTLTPNGRGLVIGVKATLWPRAPKATQASQEDEERPAPKPLYANAFAWSQRISGLPKGQVTPAEATNLWASEGGRQARLALDVGMKEMAQMIAFDLGEGGPVGTRLYTAPESAGEGAKPLPRGLKAGYVIRNVGTRTWVRLPPGDLISVP